MSKKAKILKKQFIADKPEVDPEDEERRTQFIDSIREVTYLFPDASLADFVFAYKRVSKEPSLGIESPHQIMICLLEQTKSMMSKVWGEVGVLKLLNVSLP